MNLGIIQTRGTCWFYTILNGFLLSEDGQKIMYANLQEYYEKLTPTEKAYFDDRLDAPCPMKDLTKTKKIYFWKFIDQYMCLLSGPRAVSLQIAKSANILGNMNLQGTAAKVAKGGTGAHPQQEIEKVLDHLGFKGKYYSGKVNRRRKPQFIISKAGPRTYMPIVYRTVAPGYSLMCAGLVIGNSLASSSEQHKFHSIVGYIVDEKGYIFDSNQRKVFRCNWWNLADFKRVVRDEVSLAYSFFKNGQVNVHTYSYAIYARDEFTKGISPSCRMKYRNIQSPVPGYFNYSDPNAGKRLNKPMYNYLKPAERVAAKRRWARVQHREVKYLTKATLDAILKSATSKGNALNQIWALRNSGYRVVTPDYVNFHKTLAAMKFPTKYFNKPMYDKILQNATNKVNAQKRINKLKKAGYVMKVDNFASFKQKVNEKFKNDPYAKAKATLAKASTLAQRKKAYSEVWKSVPLPRRKVLMHYRNKGVWLRNNAFNVGGGGSPNNLVLLPKNNGAGSSNQPLRNARSHVNTLKTAVARKAYLKAVVLSAEQRKNLREYIAKKNANARAVRAAKKSS